MKPKIYCYYFGASFLSVIKNGLVIDIACSIITCILKKVVFLKKIFVSHLMYTATLLKYRPKTWPCTLTGLYTQKNSGTR
jgi:hypothetical protein